MLGAFIPEFGRVVAMMQFNMYHHYTVDEHTIQTISTLSQIERGELAGRAAGRHRDRRARASTGRSLYVALLIHDLGKGSGRDHSDVGAEIARELCPRLGLDAEDDRAGRMAGAATTCSCRTSRRSATSPTRAPCATSPRR